MSTSALLSHTSASPSSPWSNSNCTSMPSPNWSNSYPNSASSPRTRIRTTLNRASSTSHNSSSETLKDSAASLTNSPAASLVRTSANQTNFSLADYQGGKEAMMETDKNPEELYTDAKEVLSLVGASPSESPCSTGGRRPPRSKHDQSSNMEEPRVPSAEAHHRLMIGTSMLNKSTGSTANSNARSPVQLLKAERAALLTEVNRAAQELSELSLQIEEAERNADLECSLIGDLDPGHDGECDRNYDTDGDADQKPFYIFHPQQNPTHRCGDARQ